jgi:hypothetical protein
MDFESKDLGSRGPKVPGRKLFSAECKAMLGRLIIGEISKDVLDHLARCGPCAVVVFGHDDILPTSLFDDVERKRLTDKLRVKDEGKIYPSKDVLAHGFDVMLKEFHDHMNSATIPGDPAAAPIGFAEGNGASIAAVVANSLSVDSASAPAQPTSIVGDFARRPALRRRRFLKLAATAIAIIAVGGTIPWFMHRSDASRGQRSPTTGLLVGPGRTQVLSRWDVVYQGSNVTAVRALMARADSQGLMTAFEWIAERRVVALYPDLVAYLADPNIDTRGMAMASILLLPPVDLKPHLAQIQAARTIESNVALQITLDQLILSVQKS